MAFHAYETDDDIHGMREQLASLTARFNGRGGGRVGGRLGKRGGRGFDPSTGSRSCYECGKQGHLCPNCLDLPRNKKKLDKAKVQMIMQDQLSLS